MKKQRYIVEIEMPDGDYISAGLLEDIIQTDCDVEDEGRQKVTVQETSLPSNLDEAAKEYSCTKNPYGANAFRAGAEWRNQQIPKLPDNLDEAIKMVDLPYEEINNTFEHSNIIEICKRLRESAFKVGAEWMAGQGVTQEDILHGDADGHPIIRLKYSLRHLSSQFKPGDKVVVQIRKK